MDSHLERIYSVPLFCSGCHGVMEGYGSECVHYEHGKRGGDGDGAADVDGGEANENSAIAFDTNKCVD